MDAESASRRRRQPGSGGGRLSTPRALRRAIGWTRLSAGSSYALSSSSILANQVSQGHAHGGQGQLRAVGEPGGACTFYFHFLKRCYGHSASTPLCAPFDRRDAMCQRHHDPPEPRPAPSPSNTPREIRSARIAPVEQLLPKRAPVVEALVVDLRPRNYRPHPVSLL